MRKAFNCRGYPYSALQITKMLFKQDYSEHKRKNNMTFPNAIRNCFERIFRFGVPAVDDLEMQPPDDLEMRTPAISVQRRVMAIELCVTSALELALLSAQIKSHLPPSFYWLSFAALLTFLCLLGANLIAPYLSKAAWALEKAALMLASTAVVFTIAIPLPLPLKCITWLLYLLLLCLVLFSHYYRTTSTAPTQVITTPSGSTEDVPPV